MSPDQINVTLAEYGASMTDEGYIRRADGKLTGVKIVQKGRRLRFEGIKLLASGARSPDSIRHFVESFWYWSKSKSC